ncbi:twin-arginine translocation signal domain-containing protein [Micromonospora sp. DR5-3]|uniref:twin-arginine translocation signal domain-containing protein n=1 Tax=unclassified Micromonospora TaxID=2617518 RepID=UPI0011D5618A|nr:MULTISPECIES: twin-arginine translocation signal domain-containing protein [unclassified Micromonospora]MCW3814685.1 twin-arginine translocation signal domain-containing protein [Micromonospora sp. DR5-3]TYC23478.1 twin-arginine translocation signal domain-containing protein [Micromonospora sp. MP36]
MPLSRRSFLAGSALTGVALVTEQSLGLLPASAENATTPTPTSYGPASLTAAVRGAAVIGDRVFITSRFNTPEGKMRLGEFNVHTGETHAIVDLAIASSGGQKLATDGRYVYVGPAGSADVYRYDPQTKELIAWARAGGATTWYYDMVVHGEHLYIGTYPDCTVKRIRLADATVETYGRISTSLYAAAVAVDDEYVYGGSAAPGRLLMWPKQGGAATDLSAHLSASPVGILDMTVSDGVLYVASGRQLISVNRDGTGRVSRDIPAEDRYVDQVAVGSDGKVYALCRLTTNLYEVTADGLVKVGQPLADVENQLLAPLPGGGLVGVSGLGHVWTATPGGAVTVWQTATRGFGYPETVQSMMRHSYDTVWVGGHYAMTVHRPEAGTSERFDVNGEVKAMAEGKAGVVYAGLYPSAQLVAINPDTFEISPLGLLGNEQLRTKRIQFDKKRNQLIVASSPQTTKHTGALTFVDLASGSFDVHREFLPEQSVMDVVVQGTTAYIVGDTYGEGTSGPLRKTAQVAAVDVVTRTLLWREEIKPDWQSYESVYVVGNLLYAVGRRPRGAWFAYDLHTRTVVMEGDLGGYGQLNGVKGRVFSWVHWTNDISALPTVPGGEVTTLYDNVPRGWYNNPMFSFTPNGRSTWGMLGNDLALFPLPEE